MPVSQTLSYNLDGPFMPASHMLDTLDTQIAYVARYAAANPNTVHTFTAGHTAFAAMPILTSYNAVSIADRFLFVAYCGEQCDYAHITQIDLHSENPNPY